MQPIWGVGIAVVAFLVILHLRNRKRRPPAPKPSGRRIDGAQLRAYLHPRVGRGCLADHGLQFGTGFRRKQSPALPHDAECQCRPVAFSYSSREVFDGALRQPMVPATSIDGLGAEDAVALLDVLKERLSDRPSRADEDDVPTSLLERFSPSAGESVASFLRERLEYLRRPESREAN